MTEQILIYDISVDKGWCITLSVSNALLQVMLRFNENPWKNPKCENDMLRKPSTDSQDTAPSGRS